MALVQYFPITVLAHSNACKGTMLFRSSSSQHSMVKIYVLLFEILFYLSLIWCTIHIDLSIMLYQPQHSSNQVQHVWYICINVEESCTFYEQSLHIFTSVINSSSKMSMLSCSIGPIVGFPTHECHLLLVVMYHHINHSLLCVKFASCLWIDVIVPSHNGCLWIYWHQFHRWGPCLLDKS